MHAFAGLPNDRLVIAGTSAQLEVYKFIATENVDFLGFVNHEELAEVIAGARAVIVPSQWYETFGMVIVEAYAAHKPVIVGDIGNIASLVEEGKTGLKFKYDSAEALKEAVEDFKKLDNSQMGENAFQKYREAVAPESNYQLLKYIYDSVNK